MCVVFESVIHKNINIEFNDKSNICLFFYSAQSLSLNHVLIDDITANFYHHSEYNGFMYALHE